MRPYDPVKLSTATEMIVTRGLKRKYYRLSRGGKWYGGIATADCVGCNLRCVFCWSNAPRDNPEDIGNFHSPEEVFKSLTRVAKRRKYNLLRISGNEPTIGRAHLFKVLELVDQTKFLFILETNGIMIGKDRRYARGLSRFKNVHVRISLKGTNETEFSRLTGAVPGAFNLQLSALRSLLDYGVSCHPAVMLSFSSDGSRRELAERLAEIDRRLVNELEEEYVFLYPHVIKRLKDAGMSPRIAYTPGNIPKELI